MSLGAVSLSMRLCAYKELIRTLVMNNSAGDHEVLSQACLISFCYTFYPGGAIESITTALTNQTLQQEEQTSALKKTASYMMHEEQL